MACKKYQLINTGSTNVYVTFRKCEDGAYERNKEIIPFRIYNLWVIDDIIESAQEGQFTLEDEGIFPPPVPTTTTTTATPGPTPTSSPTVTPTETPTPTVTPTNTVTPSVTPTITPSQTQPMMSLTLTFDNISSADSLVGDASVVSNWNTYFSLPSNGTPFSSVSISGNSVNLFNSGNISFKNMLFNNNLNLISVNDQGIVTSAGNGCFSFCNLLKSLNLPELTTAGDYCFAATPISAITMSNLVSIGEGCFQNTSSMPGFNLVSLTGASFIGFMGCTSSTFFNMPSLVTAGQQAFDGCTSLASVDFPNLTSIGVGCFQNCTALAYLSMNNLISAGNYAFYNCTSLALFSLLALQSLGFGALLNCTSLNDVYLPALTNLGGTPDDNAVFVGISGNTIIMGINSTVLTCLSGGPDGDILSLTGDNTVTISSI